MSFCLIIPIVTVFKEQPCLKNYSVNGVHNFMFEVRAESVGGVLLDGLGAQD